MTAGLFVCDHVKPEYQNEFGDYPAMFARLFPSYDWILYDVCNGQFPENLAECDVYMATGSHHSVYEELDWITQLKKVIVQLYEQRKYFVGFCFGHQLIGEALGGKVGKSLNGWCIGVHNFDIIDSPNWMTPSKNDFNILMMCQDQILELPPNTKVIASNKMCPNAMISVGNHFLGIQGHPEFTKAYNRLLMNARVERMGKELVIAGIESLAIEVDQQLIRDWVRSFLK